MDTKKCITKQICRLENIYKSFAENILKWTLLVSKNVSIKALTSMSFVRSLFQSISNHRYMYRQFSSGQYTGKWQPGTSIITVDLVEPVGFFDHISIEIVLEGGKLVVIFNLSCIISSLYQHTGYTCITFVVRALFRLCTRSSEPVVDFRPNFRNIVGMRWKVLVTLI